MSGVSWAEFTAADMACAEAGARLLVGDDGVAIGFLGTSDAEGRPRLGPACPVFSRGRLYLVASGATPKVADLRANGRYVLHAFLGAEDEEFQIAGGVRAIDDEDERSAVRADIPFPSFDAEDPIFELCVERALHVNWSGYGTPEMQRHVRRWFY